MSQPIEIEKNLGSIKILPENSDLLGPRVSIEQWINVSDWTRQQRGALKRVAKEFPSLTVRFETIDDGRWGPWKQRAAVIEGEIENGDMTLFYERFDPEFERLDEKEWLKQIKRRASGDKRERPGDDRRYHSIK